MTNRHRARQSLFGVRSVLLIMTGLPAWGFWAGGVAGM